MRACLRQVQVLDDKNVRRRFRASNYQVCCRVAGPSARGFLCLQALKALHRWVLQQCGGCKLAMRAHTGPVLF